MPTEDTQIKFFKNKKVRSIWDKESEEWYFSVVDVVEVLTESANPNNYWKVLKKRLKKEGKMYKTDCLDTQCIFRLIQSIPSPEVEPFKLWMVQQSQKTHALNLNRKPGKKSLLRLTQEMELA